MPLPLIPDLKQQGVCAVNCPPLTAHRCTLGEREALIEVVMICVVQMLPRSHRENAPVQNYSHLYTMSQFMTESRYSHTLVSQL